MNVLLKPKLYIPPAPSGIVARPRLTDRLEASLGRMLTLVSAPAGFGKTTLLSEWIGGCGIPFAWLAVKLPPVKAEGIWVPTLQRMPPRGVRTLLPFSESYRQP